MEAAVCCYEVPFTFVVGDLWLWKDAPRLPAAPEDRTSQYRLCSEIIPHALARSPLGTSGPRH